MGLLSVLFGRNKLKKPDRERFFSVVTAGFALQGRTDLRLSDFAGIVFNPVESSFFDNLDPEIRDLLRVSGHATGTRYEIKDDSFGTRWVILDDRDFEDLVSTIHMISETIHDHGFGQAVFIRLEADNMTGRGDPCFDLVHAVSKTTPAPHFEQLRVQRPTVDHQSEYTSIA